MNQPAIFAVRRTALSQPVEMTAEELEQRILDGRVSRDALISEDGGPAAPWTQHRRFAHLMRQSGVFGSVSGQHRTASSTVDAGSGSRLEALKRVRSRQNTFTGQQGAVPSNRSGGESLAAGTTFQTQSYRPASGITLTRPASAIAHGWQEPDQIAINKQWRGRPVAEMHSALLDIPVLEVFGMPWSGDRNALNIALLNLTSEIDKEAPKDEPADSVVWREQIKELLAAVHSSYTHPAHNSVAIRIQHRFERIPFVSEILPYYEENIARPMAARAEKMAAENREARGGKNTNARGAKGTRGTKAGKDGAKSSSPTRDSRDSATGRAGDTSRSAGKAGGADGAAAPQSNVKLFGIIGGILIALAAGYNVVDCGGAAEGGGGGGIGPDGQPIR